MDSVAETEGLTQKADGTRNNGDTVARNLRYTQLRGRVRRLHILVVILSILFLIATGVAIGFGVWNVLLARNLPTETKSKLVPSISEPTPRSPTLNVRLPKTILPRYYDLRLQVHLHSGASSKFFFNGSVDVDVFCQLDTNKVFVHAHQTLNISLEHIQIYLLHEEGSVSRSMKIKDIRYQDDLQWYVIETVEQLRSGQSYRFVFGKFRSYLRSDLKGWYLSSYTENGVTKYLATSQLQPTDARRVFPCWDEPSFKAKFRITIIRKKDYHSLSNMHLERTEELPNDWFADVFHPTVKTSTYLLGFVVSQFRSLSTVDYKGRNFTVWARPDVIHNAAYALDIGPRILRFFEEYLDVPYPLQKTDMVAVPDFAAGAMENWGLMIYREAVMLWDEKLGTSISRQHVASVIAHEIAHQWFGNLVTLTWWDDLWLNEGFASFGESIGVHYVHPDWEMDEQFLLNDIQRVLISDASTTSRPVIQHVRFPEEINNIFDTISYNKGASILRMMESFIGKETFRQGLKNYLSEYKFKNVVHDDFWKSMTQAVEASGQTIDVKSIMETWLLQMNYPLVKVEQLGPQVYRINQTRYLANDKKSNGTSPYNFLWHIPVTFGDMQDGQPAERGTIWLKNASMTIHLDIHQSSWYVVNLRHAGYYRVQYTDEHWRVLVAQLLANHSVIPVYSRSQLIDDLFNLANDGNMPYTAFLDLTTYLSAEDSYSVWETAAKAFRWMMQMLVMDSSYSSLLAYIRTLVDRPLKHIDWVTMQESRDHITNLFSATIVKLACKSQHPQCVQNARDLFRTWMENASTNNIPPNLRRTVYCMAIQWGGQKEWQFLSHQKNTATEEEFNHILYGLSCTRDSWNMKEFQNFLQKQYPGNDMLDSLSLVSQNALGQLLMWEQIRTAWRRINSESGTNKLPDPEYPLVMMMLRVMSRSQNTVYNIPSAEEISEMKRTRIRWSGEKVVEAFFERAEQNHRWIATHRNVIHKWLTDKVPDETTLL